MSARKVVIRAKKNNIPNFPYYNSLVAKIKEENIKEPNNKVWSQIAKFDKHNAEIIYYLILHYSRLNQCNENPPYLAKIHEGGNGVLYTVGNLPHDLKLILSVCVDEITNS